MEYERMNRITIEESLVEGIPTLAMAREDPQQRPLVFFVHGFMSHKRQGLAFGYELARAGFHFVSFDAYMHGDRFDERLGDLCSGRGDHVYPVGSGLDLFFSMHEVIVQTARDLETLIAHLAGSERVDTARVGLTGLSMGGFATFYMAANNPAIRAAAPIAGIPAFAARWRDVVLEASSYEKWAGAMEAAQAETFQRTAFMEAIDPFEKLASFHPKPLMMISGDKDIDSPKKYSVDLYRALKPVYAGCPERLRLNIHDEAGHELTPAMIQDACQWFCRYLLEPEAA
jgi:pimeloyl-ACP methyl ester carboxylesterase